MFGGANVGGRSAISGPAGSVIGLRRDLGLHKGKGEMKEEE